MSLGVEVVATAVRELASSSARSGDLEGCAGLLLGLPWRDKLDGALIAQIADRAVSDARVIPSQMVAPRAQLLVALVRDADLGLQRDGLVAAMAIAAAARDGEMVVGLASQALAEPVAADAPDVYLARCRRWEGEGLKVLERHGEAAAAYALAADRAVAAGDDDLAATAYIELGWCPYRMGAFLAALASAGAAGRAATVHDVRSGAEATKLRGACELQLRRLPEAEQAFERVIEYAQRLSDRQLESDCVGNLGLVAMLSGRFDDAIALHRRALTLSRQLGSISSELADLRNLAQTHRYAHDPESAVEALVEAVRLIERRGDPTEIAQVRLELREAYVDTGHFAEAMAIDALSAPAPAASEVTATPPIGRESDPEAEAMLAQVRELRRGRDLAGAQRVAQGLVESRPESAAGYQALGEVARDRRDDAEAVAAYERACELAPYRADFHHNLISAAGRLNGLGAMRDRYAAKVHDRPFDPYLRFGLGLCHRLGEDWDLALRELRESVALGEDSGLAALQLCCALVCKGQAIINGGERFDLDRWSQAWGYFEECWTRSQEIEGSAFVPDAELWFATAQLLVDIAQTSHDANPPVLERYGDREFEVLCSAGALLVRAMRAAPDQSAPQRLFMEIESLAQFIGEDAHRRFLERSSGLR